LLLQAGATSFRHGLQQHNRPGKLINGKRLAGAHVGHLNIEPCRQGGGYGNAGHIPGAVSIPWSQAVNEADGSFKSPEDLCALYQRKSIQPDSEVIAYRRIGERSSLTWFVLKYLLGYPNVKNYDGSCWTEWGNLVDAPIENSTTIG
jgi:thiosulfate/3-mercaptopyruvate sulfurtransferase